MYDALVHPGQKLKPGALVRFEGPAAALHGEILERRFFGRRRVRLAPSAAATADLDTSIEAIGHVPLPPYIKRSDLETDRERYQTIFARDRGSVAAPTAGLHFTPALLDALAARGVERTSITLHVGYGTFKPVRVEEVEEHVVDPEPYEISAAAAAAIARARARRPPRDCGRDDDDPCARGCGAARRRRGAARRAPTRPSSSVPDSRSASSTG